MDSGGEHRGGTMAHDEERVARGELRREEASHVGVER